MLDVTANTDLAMPAGLDAKGRLAHRIIAKFLRDEGLTYTGGCRAFYSPAEWSGRGEQYGTTSHLIVVYDGGDLRECMSLDGSYKVYERLDQRLRAAGLYSEECTCWYTAIYSL